MPHTLFSRKNKNAASHLPSIDDSETGCTAVSLSSFAEADCSISSVGKLVSSASPLSSITYVSAPETTTTDGSQEKCTEDQKDDGTITTKERNRVNYIHHSNTKQSYQMVCFDLSSNIYINSNASLTERDRAKLWWGRKERATNKKRLRNINRKALNSNETRYNLKLMYDACIYGKKLGGNSESDAILLGSAIIEHSASDARGLERSVLSLLQNDRMTVTQTVLSKQAILLFGNDEIGFGEGSKEECLAIVSRKMSKHHQQFARMLATGDEQVVIGFKSAQFTC